MGKLKRKEEGREVGRDHAERVSGELREQRGRERRRKCDIKAMQNTTNSMFAYEKKKSFLLVKETRRHTLESVTTDLSYIKLTNLILVHAFISCVSSVVIILQPTLLHH